MSYTALYRKFRPVEFEDVKGQEHIITTLKNQIEANRIGHAYLFCGTRVRDVPLYCSGYIDECDRDRCSFEQWCGQHP